MMKARGRDRRFFSRGVAPNICVLQAGHSDRAGASRSAWFRGIGRQPGGPASRDVLLHDLALFRQVDNIGSLLQPQLTPEQIETLRATAIGAADDLLSRELNERVLHALEQLAYLARKYHVVVANPPYMGGGMNDDLKAFAQDHYPDSKSDLFAMFIERNLSIGSAAWAGGYDHHAELDVPIVLSRSCGKSYSRTRQSFRWRTSDQALSTQSAVKSFLRLPLSSTHGMGI